MKRSSPSLQFLAAAASTDATTTIMSSRSPYRGGRNQWRRRFSDRTSGDGNDQFVTGDSHFRSVRDANRGFRPAERGNFANQSSFRPQPRYQSFNPQPPPFNSRPPFDHHNPPSFNPNQPFQPPPPPFYQNQQFRPPQQFRPQPQFRPRPQKPLDYRNWEYSRPGPPPDCERFTVLSYNILADYLATNHRSKLYFHIPRHILDWEFRKRNIIFELGLWSADILCFQEVDRFQDLQEELQVRGYSGIWKMRTGDPVDGCAIFWRFSRFKLLQEESIEFNKLGLRDNIAQICVLESMNQNHNRCTSAHPASAASSNKVVVCNIHVLYNPRRGEIKLGQVRVLLSRAYAVSKLWDDAPVVLCGDFNFTPKSPLYNFISEQKLNLSELPRDKLSGQASAEIQSPRPFFANVRSQSGGDSAQTPAMVVENSALAYEPIKGHQGKEDACNDKTELTLSVPDSGLNESLSSSVGGGGSSVDQMKDGVHECSPVNSRCEDIYPNVIETGQREDIYATSNASSGSSGEHSQANLHAENKSLNCEKVINGNDCASTLYGSVVDEKMENLSLNEPIEASEDGTLEHSSLNEPIEATEDGTLEHSSLNEPIEATEDGTLEHSSLNEPIEATEGGTLEHFSLNEPIEATEDGTLGEDCTTFLSELHNTEGCFPYEFGVRNKSSEVLDDSLDMDSEPVDVEKTTYDPSAWTPMEIETATGSSDCTIMEHPLKLRSTYSEVEDYSGTRDSSGEPLVTSYNRCFLGTVDYIWHSEGLQTARVLAPIQRHAMQWTPGFPTKKWGSDHIALVSELAFTKDAGAR